MPLGKEDKEFLADPPPPKRGRNKKETGKDSSAQGTKRKASGTVPAGDMPRELIHDLQLVPFTEATFRKEKEVKCTRNKRS
jgi:hypothetical protein